MCALLLGGVFGGVLALVLPGLQCQPLVHVFGLVLALGGLGAAAGAPVGFGVLEEFGNCGSGCGVCVCLYSWSRVESSERGVSHARVKSPTSGVMGPRDGAVRLFKVGHEAKSGRWSAFV